MKVCIFSKQDWYVLFDFISVLTMKQDLKPLITNK